MTCQSERSSLNLFTNIKLDDLQVERSARELGKRLHIKGKTIQHLFTVEGFTIRHEEIQTVLHSLTFSEVELSDDAYHMLPL